MSGFRNSAGVDFDNLFDPDVMGDGYVATFLRGNNGQGLHYAAAKYGTPGPTVGYRDSGGTDVGPKWAAKGTAQYSLPINGGTYTTTLTRDGTSGARASVKFIISGGNSWSLASSGLAGQANPGTNFASGSLPAGSVNVEFTTASATGTAQTAGTTGSQIAVSTNPALEAFVTSAGTIGTANGSIQVTVVFYNSGGAAISTTTYTANMVIQN